MRILAALFVIMLAIPLSDASAGRVVSGMVRKVYDGDTLELVTRERTRLKARLYGIDAPETEKPDHPGQPFGDAAKNTLMFKVMGKTVTAEIMDVDDYNRTVAVIRLDRRDINREMVREGMAWAYRHYLKGPYASEYIDSEAWARRKRLGLWRDANPQPPWEFRQGLRKNHRR